MDDAFAYEVLRLVMVNTQPIDWSHDAAKAGDAFPIRL